MVPPSGTCVSVRVARSSMPADAVAANTLAALQGVVKHIPKKWANVQVGGRGRRRGSRCWAEPSSHMRRQTCSWLLWHHCHRWACTVMHTFSRPCPGACLVLRMLLVS